MILSGEGHQAGCELHGCSVCFCRFKQKYICSCMSTSWWCALQKRLNIVINQHTLETWGVGEVYMHTGCWGRILFQHALYMGASSGLHS